MVSFVIGTVLGGCAAAFFMALFSANQKADSMESDYYKHRLIGVADRIKTIISSFRSHELSANDAMNQIEDELKL